MPFNFKQYQKVMESMYSDRMDVYVVKPVESETGETNNVYTPRTDHYILDGSWNLDPGLVFTEVFGLQDVPCRLSLTSSRDNPKTGTEEQKIVDYTPRIFCDPGLDVPAGSKVVVRRCYSDGTVYETYEGLIPLSGRANKYETHQEFEVNLAGDP